MKIDTDAKSGDLEYWVVGVAMCGEDENAEDKNLVLPNINSQGKNLLEKEVHQELVTVLVPQLDNVKGGRPINYAVLKAGNQQEYDTLLGKTEYTMIGDYLVLKTNKTTSLITILLKPRQLEHVQIYQCPVKPVVLGQVIMEDDFAHHTTISQIDYGMWSSVKYIDRDEASKMFTFQNLMQITYMNNCTIIDMGNNGVFREVVQNDSLCRLMNPNNFINAGINLRYSFQDDESYSDVIERKFFFQNQQASMTAIYEQRLRPTLSKKTGEKGVKQLLEHYSNQIYKTYTELDLRELLQIQKAVVMRR